MTMAATAKATPQYNNEEIMGRVMSHKTSATWLAIFCQCYFAGHFSTAWANQTATDEYVEFNSEFLRGDTSALGIDVRRFSYKNGFSAGKHELDIYVNGEKKGAVDAKFITDPNGDVLSHLCLTPALKAMLDLQPQAYQPTKELAPDCLSAEQSLPDAKFDFDVATLSIRLTIAQALTVRRPRGYVPPQLWQEGVPAFYVNYYLNHFHNRLQSAKTTQTYLGIRTGVNVAGWHLVHHGSKSWQQTSAYTNFSSQYQYIETHLRRAIPSLRTEMVIGDMSTNGELLDSVSLRGVRFSSDDSVLPSSQRGYAPIIRGVAKTNANVIVRQNGYIIHQMSVPAGQFVIDDLNPTGYGGDIQVEVLESNGEKREFKVPFATLIQLVRPNHLKYQLAYGRYRVGSKIYRENVLQTTVQYGLFNNLSVNAGLSYTPNYRAYLVGMGLNTPIGAFIADTTWSQAYFTHRLQSRKGYSIRASYSVKLPMETYITLATYRYSSREFYRLSDTLAANHQAVIDDRVIQSNLSYRPKSQYQLSISQHFGEKGGTLFLSGSVQHYWQRAGRDYQYQLAYSNAIGRLSYHLGYQSSKNAEAKRDHNVYLSVSMPLGKQHASIRYTQGYQHHDMSAHLSGQIANTGANYGVSLSQSKNNHRAVSGNVDYQLPFAHLSATASHDSQRNHQYSVNLSGAVVAHPKGVTLSQQHLNDTYAIVHAKGAKGAKINGLAHNMLDRFGNGVVPYLSPYRRNYLSIDPDALPLNMEFEATAKEVIPKANHAMLVEFGTSVNPMVLFDVQYAHGTIPMGSEAFDEQGQLVGYVVQGGQLFASRLDKAIGRITLRWASDQDGQCQFGYHVPDLQHNEQLRSFNVVCEKVKDKAE